MKSLLRPLLSAILLAGLVPAFAVYAAPPFTQEEVDRAEVLRLGDTVQAVGGGPRAAAADAFVEAMQPPADDNHKWFVSVVTMQGCAPCAKLKRDFANDPNLRALVNTQEHKQSWAHYNVYSIEDESQAWRFKNIKLTAFPTVIVQPPLNKKFGEPSTVVYQAAYGGDPKKLFDAITGAIRLYVAKQQSTPGPRQTAVAPLNDPHPLVVYLTAGYGQVPWKPVPKTEPPVAPQPDAVPAPNLFPFDIGPPPPLPDAQPVQPKPDAPKPVDETTSIPNYPEVVIVEDGDAQDDDSGELLKFAERLKKKRHGNVKIRRIDWKLAEKIYPLRRDELPAAVVTSEGRIEGKVLARLLALMAPEEPKPTVNPPATEPAKEVGIETFPIDSLLTMLLTKQFSLGLAIPIVIWGVMFVRSKRRAAGQNVIAPQLDEARFQMLLQGLATMVTSQINRQSPAAPAKPAEPVK